MLVRSYYLEYAGAGEKDAGVAPEGRQGSKEKTRLFADIYKPSNLSFRAKRGIWFGVTAKKKQIHRAQFARWGRDPRADPALGMTTFHDLEGWPVTKRIFAR